MVDVVKRGALSLLLVVVLAAATGGQAQADQSEDPRTSIEAREGHPITFYGHVLAHGRDAPVPMNTQFPDGADDYSLGTFGNCGTFNGVPTWVTNPYPFVLAGGDHEECDAYEGNENWWFTTPGFVQVKTWETFDYGDLHNERGQTKDIYFDLDEPITATFYMSADWHGWSTAFCDVSWCWNWDPGYLLDWVVETTVYHGSLGEAGSAASEAPDMDLIYGSEDATVIAKGVDGPKAIASFDPTLQPVAGPLCEDECRTVNEFHPVLEYSDEFVAQGGIVPKENDIVVRHQWYQLNGDEKYIMGIGVVVGTAWNLNGGEDNPANIVFPIKNPLDVELVFPRFIHDKLVILSVLNTPWGSYDVDLESIALEVRDANGILVDVDPRYISRDLDVSVAHSGHYNPIDVTWVWDYQRDGLGPGEYTATVLASNFQGSYNASTTASFEITAEGTGGATQSGTEGLLSFTENQFDEFREGSQTQAGDGDAIEQESLGDQAESEDTPAAGAWLAIMALAAAVVAWRRRA